MNPSSIPLVSSVRHNPSINISMDGDAETSQLLTPRGEDSRPTTIRARSRSHTGNAAGCDPRGHWDLSLSMASFVVSTLIFNLHIFEKYNEDHKAILAAETINLLLTASLVAKNILRCCTWSLTASKRAAQWALQAEDPLEQDAAENDVSCVDSIIQRLIDDPLYYRALTGLCMTTGLSFSLSFREKDHENHALILSLEGASMLFSFALVVLKYIKIAEQHFESAIRLPNRQQQAQFSPNHPNYQTV